MTTKPKIYAVSISTLALSQLEEACNYIHAQGAPLAAQRMAARFEAAIGTLENYPQRGRHVSRGIYELLTVHPYVIRYRIQRGAVEVVRVRHAAQRPG